MEMKPEQIVQVLCGICRDGTIDPNIESNCTFVSSFWA